MASRKPARPASRTEPSSAKAAAKSSARSTASGPAHKGKNIGSADSATAKMAGTEALAEAFPFNAAKPSEFGGSDPATGQTAKPAAPMVTGSTLTETNSSDKVGSGNPPAGTLKGGFQPAFIPLLRNGHDISIT